LIDRRHSRQADLGDRKTYCTAHPASRRQSAEHAGEQRRDPSNARWFGSSNGPKFCFIVGHVVPFDQATLPSLYPTHGAHVRGVIRDVFGLVAQRYLTPADGLKLIHQAQPSAGRMTFALQNPHATKL
jgi:hypothetical protein